MIQKTCVGHGEKKLNKIEGGITLRHSFEKSLLVNIITEVMVYRWEVKSYKEVKKKRRLPRVRRLTLQASIPEFKIYMVSFFGTLKISNPKFS